MYVRDFQTFERELVKEMKNRILLIFAVLLALTLPVTPVHAQTTTVTTTTLSAVVAAKDQYVTVASATGITAQGSTGAYTTILYIDDEGMPVVSLSGTRVRVQRDTGQSHANGSKVWIAAPSAFGNGDPRRGPCAVANQPSLLIVKSRIWKCSATGATTAKWGTFDGLDPVIGTAIASDATAMAIQSQIVHITGTAELA